MKRVFKYPLALTDYQEIDLPIGAKILNAQMQGYQLCLWALIDDEANGFPKTRTIRVAGTGHAIVDDHIEFISTFLMHGGKIVFHVFEVKG